MTELVRDLRYSVRRLARSPGFTAVAILSLALGIGANTAIFSIVNAVLIRDLTVRAPEELVEVYTADSGGYEYATSSYPDYRDLREGATVFQDIAGYQSVILSMARDDGTSEILWAELVTGNLFRVLGVDAALGRTFTPDEDATPGAHPVAVISHAFWQRQFGGDPDVVGRTILTNGRQLTIVGVLSETYTGRFPGLEMDLWAPMSMIKALNLTDEDELETRTMRSMFLTARLRPGVTVDQARAEVRTIGARLAAAYPESNENRGMTVLPTSKVSFNPIVDRALAPAAALLMVVVGLVLAIASANLASLLLVRAAGRTREIATRLAIGAGRGRLVRQLLTESVVLALAGGVVGLGLAYVLVRMIMGFTPPLPVPIHLDIAPDGGVLAFTFALSVGTGILFGLAPALRASRPELLPALKDEGISDLARHRRFGLRNGLIVGQVMVSLLLLVTAGLFVRSLSEAQRIDAGFDTEHVASALLNLRQHGYTGEEPWLFFQELKTRAEAIPGVRSVSLAGRLPVGMSIQLTSFEVEGAPEPEDGHWPEWDYTRVGPEYFETLGVPIVRGRAFETADQQAGTHTAIVSETAARRLWPGQDPLGKRLRSSENRPWLEVVGVARDTKVRTLGEAPRPYIYLPFKESADIDFGMIVIATDGDPAPHLARLRAEITAMDPAVTPFQAVTIQEQLAVMLYPARLGAILLAAFGVLALLLAVTGLYGVVSYTASRRTREVGIRMALGARPGDVAGMVLRDGAGLVAVGVVLGLGLAFGLTRLLSRFLYGIGVTDLITFMAIPLLLAGVALLASWLPARRASRLDPMRALRYE